MSDNTGCGSILLMLAAIFVACYLIRWAALMWVLIRNL